MSPKIELLRHATTEQHVESIQELGARHEVPVLGRLLLRVPERGHTARDDGDLRHPVRVLARLRDQRMAGFVVGDDLFFLRVDHARSTLETAHHAVDSLVEVRRVHGLLTRAGGVERGLVDEIGEIGADEARRSCRHQGEIEAWTPA